MRSAVRTFFLLCGAMAVFCRESGDMGKSVMNEPLPPPETYAAETTSPACKEMMRSGDKGVGPITGVAVGAVNRRLAQKGEVVFRRHCSHCHSLTTPETGPALGDAAAMHTAEYVMNMIVNPQGMEQNDTMAESLARCYGILMPPTGLDSSQARAAMEYLRAVKE